MCLRALIIPHYGAISFDYCIGFKLTVKRELIRICFSEQISFISVTVVYSTFLLKFLLL